MANGEVMYINYEEGVKRVLNNNRLFVKLLAKFKAETNLDDLGAALAAGDMEKAQAAAHTVKGVAANLSLTELYKQALEIETQIKARSVKEGALETVKNVYEETVKSVEKVIEQYGG
ncbi:MAG: Hpt domain-containing protein [Treponema sp.]|jgi:HPt (histidine-containing phosphotransfer) domain-containing protein|nr:Hpt domain-containing protein [Treponema sp.]